MKHNESVVKIYFSREYGSFKFLKGNRDINESKVKKIMKDIKSGYDILKYAPIIVNENMEIIDGQHRYAVARELGENVHYVICRDSELSLVPKINSKSSNWKTVDFLNSYLDLKRPEYVRLEEFREKYPKLGVAMAFKLLYAGYVNGDKAQEAVEVFKDGSFVINNLEKATEVCDLLNDFIPYTNNPFSRTFIVTMQAIMNNGKYDHNLMLEKLEETGKRIENVESQKTILYDMEQIINHRMRNRIIIH